MSDLNSTTTHTNSNSDVDFDIINSCPMCIFMSPRFCLSHTCPDCNSPSTNVELHSSVCTS